MGIRKSQGKNKKSKRGAAAIEVKREETVKKAARETGRATHSRPGPPSKTR